MTTEEFKMKYPLLAHLEGNELWNAMEKAIILDKGCRIIETQEDFEKEIRENFTDDRPFDERFGKFGLLIPAGADDSKPPIMSYNTESLP